jgi:hypothetical protein
MQKAPLGSARICRAVGAQIADTYYTNIFDLTLPAGLSAVRGAIAKTVNSHAYRGFSIWLTVFG